MDPMALLCDIADVSAIFEKSVSIESIMQRIVVLVAQQMKTDVCSIYLYEDLREKLVLKATKGLNPDSVDKVSLNLGEGIAGFALEQGKPVHEGVASEHPQFKFFPDIGEENFEAFLAVPILHGISKIGVLVVQRKLKNSFTEKDVMAVRAIASQLGIIIENARLLMKIEAKPETKSNTRLLKEIKFIKAKAASEGFTYTDAVVFDNERLYEELTNREFERLYTLAEFERALKSSEKQLEELQERIEEKLSDVASLIFAAHIMVLKDQSFVGKMRNLITGGENPPRAIKKVSQEYITFFSLNPAPYIREKVEDIKDLVIRLMRNLLSDSLETGRFRGRIVIAKELFPSDILKLSSEDVQGIILVTGGVTSHLAILARSLRIPLIIADVPELLGIPEHTKILMDADMGNIYINPSEEILSPFKYRDKAHSNLQELKNTMSPTTLSADGIRITLMANINLLSDLKIARDLHADGIGLYRTEFPFLIRSNFPSEEEQFIVYRKLIEGMPDKEITFRTLDIGGDKVLSYYQIEKEQNPFLGMRSIRFSLRNKDIFKQQIRGILRAGARTRLKIMFPMISSIDEFLDARDTLLECVDELRREGVERNEKPQVGMMVEIPSVVDIIDDFAQVADFFSIGTNDFIQYMLAVDRTNEKVAEFYLPHHPSVLRAIKKVVDAACRHGIEVSICGEMSHDERYLPFLLGIGIRLLSVDPMYLPKIQHSISRIRICEAQEFARSLLEQTQIKSVAQILFNANTTHNI